MNYSQAKEYLFNLQLHKIKLGLGSMRNFLASVGGPEKELKFVHVAGTNGKGSVSVTLLTLLVEAGYRVGLYTSPHLSSVRERFRVNDNFMSRDSFAELSTKIRDSLGQDKITYFEFTTALALLWFAESDLDLVVLETGLGGRLDATNVVLPLLSVITNVSMDHESWLGNTLREVAVEKAGIIKEDIPLVSGVAFDESLEVVEEFCRQEKAPLYLLDRDFTAQAQVDGTWSFSGMHHDLTDIQLDGLKCSMKGSYQLDNASLALAALALLRPHGFTVSGEQIRKALKNVYWPGRLEYFCINRGDRSFISRESKGNEDCICYLLDGAHNPAGVDSLVTTLEREYKYQKLIVVWGAMLDKDLGYTLERISTIADQIILTRPEGDRSADPSHLQKQLPEEMIAKSQLLEPVAEALAQAEKLVEANDLIVVAGSLYLVGAAHGLLRGSLVDK